MDNNGQGKEANEDFSKATNGSLPATPEPEEYAGEGQDPSMQFKENPAWDEEMQQTVQGV